jgi:hypothetical protein
MRNAVSKSLAAVVAVGILAVGAAAVKAGSLENRLMYISFSRPVALPGVELNAGTYAFELAAPMTDSSLVRVSSKDHRTVYLTAFTLRVDRPKTLRPGQVVTLGEAPRGVAAPVTAWFPEDSTEGRQFIYR